jgi:hypothetical protein
MVAKSGNVMKNKKIEYRADVLLNAKKKRGARKMYLTSIIRGEENMYLRIDASKRIIRTAKKIPLRSRFIA